MLRSIFIAAFVLLTAPCTAQETSPLRFDETQWDFGTVREEDGRVSHDFGFVNTGDHPVAIDRVNVSCGCTTPEFPRSPVQPGGKASVTVSFDPTGYSGDFSKSVIVVSGGGRNYDMLTVTGKIIPRPKTIEEEYPFEMTGGLRVDHTSLNFRQIQQGKSSSMVIRYVNASDRNISLEITGTETSGLIGVYAPETICPGCRGDMTFTYDLTGKTGHYGIIHDVLQVAVDGVTAGKTIYASMIGIDDFSGRDLATAPKMALDAQFHNYGEVRRRTVPYVKRFTVANDGKETLVIRGVTSEPGLKTTLRDGITVAPGAKLPFEVLLYSDKYENGNLGRSIIITVNDPLRPVREIRIAAKID